MNIKFRITNCTSTKFTRMQLKVLVNFNTVLIEVPQREKLFWILYENSTKLEASRMHLDLVDLDLLALTRIDNVFVPLFKKILKLLTWYYLNTQPKLWNLQISPKNRYYGISLVFSYYFAYIL